jgi:hypothetical protein
MSFRDTFLQLAQNEVGVREVGANNEGPQIVEYQSASWLPPGQWPWCAAFIAWVLMRAILTDQNSPITMAQRCKDARAYGWEEWAKKQNLEMFPESHNCLPGDIITFDFSHIGIVVQDDGGFIQTIEGNTNGRGDRDSELGDGVWKKTRRRELIKTIIRLPG